MKKTLKISLSLISMFACAITPVLTKNINNQKAEAVVSVLTRPTILISGVYKYSSRALGTFKKDFHKEINNFNFDSNHPGLIDDPLFVSLPETRSEMLSAINSGDSYFMDMREISPGCFTGNDYCTNYADSSMYSLDYVFDYYPQIAGMNITVSSIKSTSVKSSASFGVYFEESYAVASAVNAEIGVSESNFSSKYLTWTIDMTEKPQGKYGLFLQFKKCTKYIVKYNIRDGKMVNGYKIVNCPSDAYSVVAKPIA